ncbi:5-demethoxyubiquinol-8 5-hydroxylase UbiM [Pseudoxanthomonas sp. SE1]|uniref:5-demethoxyubiquinol-8 5-hydroxylase UbiM n=1 Tax=Pseudoxanthomonas sp. SE1 TaxID=1664560 RepID=UPI00240DCFD5|nr:5-demethoxyubiquinol-8 5-hydroxylase UbiM [Pseudoxanthomonas sp. SE1]WFC40566.1 5-demethoxyubiquinol-8 5-hydroxylase UbiM [Pseudoxanthomonas sp. SE1]
MHHDVIIIGAGPAGLCLAKALCDLDLKVALVERQPRAAIAEPAFDGREIALTHASMRQLRDLGIWQHLPEGACSSLRAARVMEGNCLHDMRIDAGLADKQELGVLVPNHCIREAAWKAVCDLPGVDVFDSARIHAVRTTDDHACVTLGDGLRLEAPLLVAADSRFSETRRAMGIGADQYDFGKSMLVCRMHHEQPHRGVAWEWFGHGQTLAMLPLQEHQSSIVVTLPDSAAKRLAGLDVDTFAREMEQRYGHRLGHMRLESSRHVYPLVGVYARRFIGRRFALVGDAAVGMHPVTAHGFNLGLASVERLAGMAREALRCGGDLGCAEGLARYERRHRRGSRPLYLATRAIVELYTNDRAPARIVRETVLRAGRRFTPFRRVLARTLADERPLDRHPLQRLRDGFALLRPG